MKLKLYRSNNHTHLSDPYIVSADREALPFEIEKDRWELVDNIAEADVVPVGCLYTKDQWDQQVKILHELGCTNRHLILIMNIFDDCDTYDWEDWHNRFNNFIHIQRSFRSVYVTNSKIPFMHTDRFVIHYDLMFNRQKAYMTEIEKFDTTNKVYFHFQCNNNFRLNPIQKIGKLSDRKIALCPNRIMELNARSGLRRILKLFMQNKSVILGDPTNGKILEPEDENMLQLMQQTKNGGSGLWMPIANKYYEQTYISMYIETCTVSQPRYCLVKTPHQSITEKTFDPLIKGHFILPFGYAGIVKDIRDYGFKLPSWINYSYDDIKDCDRHRFAAYLEEADRLLNMPIETIEQHYVKDFDMLIHNRQVFWSKSYVPLYPHVEEKFKTVD